MPEMHGGSCPHKCGWDFGSEKPPKKVTGYTKLLETSPRKKNMLQLQPFHGKRRKPPGSLWTVWQFCALRAAPPLFGMVQIAQYWPFLESVSDLPTIRGSTRGHGFKIQPEKMGRGGKKRCKVGCTTSPEQNFPIPPFSSQPFLHELTCSSKEKKMKRSPIQFFLYHLESGLAQSSHVFRIIMAPYKSPPNLGVETAIYFYYCLRMLLHGNIRIYRWKCSLIFVRLWGLGIGRRLQIG